MAVDPILTMPAATRDSIRYVLSLYGVPEAREAVQMLEAGRVDGTRFYSTVSMCGCLIGTLEAARSVDSSSVNMSALRLSYDQTLLHGYDPTRPAQDWFKFILPGHTPANSVWAHDARDVIVEWISEQIVDVGRTGTKSCPDLTTSPVLP